MPIVKPFAAVRPRPELAAALCELPYDVMSSAEARVVAAERPLSFLRVSKAEIELPPETDPYAPEVYLRARHNFQRLLSDGALRPDAEPSLYLYRQVMGSHAQLGLVAVCRCQDYVDGIIKKHEFTRPDKENDRVRHIEALNAQTGPAFLVYRAVPALEACLRQVAAGPPGIDFTAADGVQHTAWRVGPGPLIAEIQARLAAVPCFYIADGHHRTAAAARVCQARAGAGASAWFLAVLFAHDQVQILPYHRALKDLNGLTPAGLLERLQVACTLEPGGPPSPLRPHELSLYLAGRWHHLRFQPACLAAARTPLEKLDVTLFQQHVLEPVFGIKDPRTSQRLQFVGGIRGTGELERLVNGGESACAFALYPTRIEDLMAVAERDAVMPPKSTWFEPKLRDGMFCHRI